MVVTNNKLSGYNRLKKSKIEKLTPWETPCGAWGLRSTQKHCTQRFLAGCSVVKLQKCNIFASYLIIIFTFLSEISVKNRLFQENRIIFRQNTDFDVYFKCTNDILIFGSGDIIKNQMTFYSSLIHGQLTPFKNFNCCAISWLALRGLIFQDDAALKIRPISEPDYLANFALFVALSQKPKYLEKKTRTFE